MNDFTKGELQIIWIDMQFYANQSKPLNESPSHCELREKIADMIDNYCEHELYETSALINHCVNCEKSKVISL